MKYLKKFASIALALIMVLALAAPAFADEPEHKSTLHASDESHSFTAYQLMTGTMNEDGTIIASTAEWATGIEGASVLNALKNTTFKNADGTNITPNPFAEVESTDAPAIALELAKFEVKGNALNTEENKQLLAKAIYENAVKGKDGIPSYVVDSTNQVDYGYCLATETVGENDTAPVYHLHRIYQAVTTFNVKKGDSTVKKEVQQIEKIWSDGAVYQLDEEIPFRLIVNLPDDLYTSYTNLGADTGYNMVLHDIMDPGLDPASVAGMQVKLYAKGEDIDDATKGDVLRRNDNDWTSGVAYTYTQGTCTDPKSDTNEDGIEGCTFEVKVNNLQQNQAQSKKYAGGKLVVTYTAKLNADGTGVKYGTTGNQNEVILQVNGQTKGNDQVKVYDLQIQVEKQDANGSPLSGASFALYTRTGDTDKVGTYLKDLTPNAEDIYVNASGEQKTKSELIAAELATAPAEGEEFTAPNGWTLKYPAGSFFTVTDVKPGKYFIKETVMPDGKEPGASSYTTPDDIEIEIKTEITATPTLPTPGTLKLTVTESTNSFKEVGDSILGAVTNVTGTLLPSTGGIGTTIFYVVGGVLVLGAVVLLITKRRTSVDDE